jgi:hypothetical protein
MELLVVIGLLAICSVVGSVGITGGLQIQRARGAAQVWQTAAAWAQVGVLWQEGSTELRLGRVGLRLDNDLGLCGGSLGQSGPTVPTSSNVSRWAELDGVTVSFGHLGAPDGGGSVFFQGWRSAYRVVVRPESGVTTRSVIQP